MTTQIENEPGAFDCTLRDVSGGLGAVDVRESESASRKTPRIGDVMSYINFFHGIGHDVI